LSDQLLEHTLEVFLRSLRLTRLHPTVKMRFDKYVSLIPTLIALINITAHLRRQLCGNIKDTWVK